MRTTGTMSSRTRPTATSSLGDRQGPHRLDGPRAAKAAPGVIAIVTAQNAGKLGKGNFNTALLLGGPNIQHYHQAIALVVAETFEQARAAAHLVRVQYAPAKGAYDLEAAMKDSAKPADSFGSRRRKLGRRLRRRLRRCARAARRQLHHGARVALDDGAARDHRRVGRRPAHALDREPDDRVERGGHGEDARHPEGEGARHVALHRRRLRREALASRRRAAGRARCARSATAGEGRAGARHHAQQHRAPLGHPAAHPHRRHEGRQDHRHRPRELVRRPPGRQARSRGGANRARCTRGPTA